MDEKMLDEWLKHFDATYKNVPGSEHKELIRLARLGLWAEKHGAPTLTSIASGHIPEAVKPYHWEGVSHPRCAEVLATDTRIAREALAAHPEKEGG